MTLLTAVDSVLTTSSRRCKQYVIPVLAIDGTAHRVANQTGIKGHGFEAHIEFVGWANYRFAVAVGDKSHNVIRPEALDFYF